MKGTEEKAWKGTE